jgi:hypothetical protein
VLYRTENANKKFFQSINQSSQATEGMDFLSSENMDESVGLSFPENDLSNDSRHGSLGLSCPMTALMNLRDYLA